MSVFKKVGLMSLQPHPINADIYGDVTDVDELAESIKEIGLQTPLIVRLLPSGLYRIISGERRWRACVALNIQEIPVVVREFHSEDEEELVLIHCNKQRAKSKAQIAEEFTRVSAIADRIASLRKSASKTGAKSDELLALEQEVGIDGEASFDRYEYVEGATGIKERRQLALARIMKDDIRERELGKLRSYGATMEQLAWLKGAWNDVRAAYKQGAYSDNSAVEEIDSLINKLRKALDEAKKYDKVSKNHAKKETTKYGDAKLVHSDKNLTKFVKNFLSDTVVERMMSDREALEAQLIWAVRRYIEVVKS